MNISIAFSLAIQSRTRVHVQTVSAHRDKGKERTRKSSFGESTCVVKI